MGERIDRDGSADVPAQDETRNFNLPKAPMAGLFNRLQHVFSDVVLDHGSGEADERERALQALQGRFGFVPVPQEPRDRGKAWIASVANGIVASGVGAPGTAVEVRPMVPKYFTHGPYDRVNEQFKTNAMESLDDMVFGISEALRDDHGVCALPNSDPIKSPLEGEADWGEIHRQLTHFEMYEAKLCEGPEEEQQAKTDGIPTRSSLVVVTSPSYARRAFGSRLVFPGAEMEAGYFMALAPLDLKHGDPLLSPARYQDHEAAPPLDSAMDSADVPLPFAGAEVLG